VRKVFCLLGVSILITGCGQMEESTEANPAEAQEAKEKLQEIFETSFPEE
jgi:uncharacterized protein YceK